MKPYTCVNAELSQNMYKIVLLLQHLCSHLTSHYIPPLFFKVLTAASWRQTGECPKSVTSHNHRPHKRRDELKDLATLCRVRERTRERGRREGVWTQIRSCSTVHTRSPKVNSLHHSITCSIYFPYNFLEQPAAIMLSFLANVFHSWLPHSLPLPFVRLSVCQGYSDGGLGL